MNPSLRKILADSHVSAVAIAVLLFRSLDSAIWILWGPLSMAILTFPNFPRTDRFTSFITISYLFNSLVYLAAAWLLSRWVYGKGPLRSLSQYRTILTRRNDA